MERLHWCCFRLPICRSLKSLILGHCKVGERAMTLLAAAIQQESALSEFAISFREVKDADTTRIILGKNRLEKFWPLYYRLRETEVGAFLLAARKRNLWKHFVLGLNTYGHDTYLKVLTWILQVASKSPAEIRLR